MPGYTKYIKKINKGTFKVISTMKNLDPMTRSHGY